jgi:hypothetical protein
MKFVEGQRELGPLAVSELAIRDGKLVFRTESGGCTAFLVDGVLIELDREKDLGLEGTYTISVGNPVYRRPGGTS